MSQPTVCAVMLVNGREAMVGRAIKSFREQTYGDRILYILDTGENALVDALPDRYPDFGIMYHNSRQPRGRTVGALRNYAMSWEPASTAHIICHWDSDDWSHPNRIAEQVALLQSSGKQCVGYRDMLFWQNPLEHESHMGRAWLYSNPDHAYCLGTSLCYWRSVWEARPFPDLPKAKGGTGEDVAWLTGVDSFSVESFRKNPPEDLLERLNRGENLEPRMIASIHGANTQYYNPAEYVARERGTSWKRAAEWDVYCRERMAL